MTEEFENYQLFSISYQWLEACIVRATFFRQFLSHTTCVWVRHVEKNYFFQTSKSGFYPTEAMWTSDSRQIKECGAWQIMPFDALLVWSPVLEVSLIQISIVCHENGICNKFSLILSTKELSRKVYEINLPLVSSFHQLNECFVYEDAVNNEVRKRKQVKCPYSDNITRFKEQFPNRIYIQWTDKVRNRYLWYKQKVGVFSFTCKKLIMNVSFEVYDGFSSHIWVAEFNFLIVKARN